MPYKYVMFKTKSVRGQPERMIPIIFPEEIVHLDIVRASELLSAVACDLIPMSAGFCNLSVSDASGHSESADLVSHPDDERIINTMPYMHGLTYVRKYPSKKKGGRR
jgi:hypothetical protein